jgi:hypothetical protein
MSELLCVKVVDQFINIIMSISVTFISNTPDKIVNKGADFFRRSPNSKGLFGKTKFLGVRVMVFNATFNNASVISWRSVLLVEETGVPREYNRSAASH